MGGYADMGGRAGGCCEAIASAAVVGYRRIFFAGWEFSCNFVEANGGRGYADTPCQKISSAQKSAYEAVLSAI